MLPLPVLPKTISVSVAKWLRRWRSAPETRVRIPAETIVQLLPFQWHKLGLGRTGRRFLDPDLKRHSNFRSLSFKKKISNTEKTACLSEKSVLF